MTHVIVDAPRTEARNVSPTVVATTTPTAYVRFHGRNAATWNKRARTAAERFDYLYSDDELGEWVEPLSELSGQPDERVRDVQQQRALDDAGPACARRFDRRWRDGGPGARERPDAAGAARARRPPGHARSSGRHVASEP
mgnify:CR=1 FL=1